MTGHWAASSVTTSACLLQRSPGIKGHERVWETARYNALSILNGFLSKEWTQRWFRISATYENNLNVMKNYIDHSMEITKRVVPGVESNSQPCDCVSHAYGMYYCWICMVPRLITKNPYFRSHSLCDDMFDWIYRRWTEEPLTNQICIFNFQFLHKQYQLNFNYYLLLLLLKIYTINNNILLLYLLIDVCCFRFKRKMSNISVCKSECDIQVFSYFASK